MRITLQSNKLGKDKSHYECTLNKIRINDNNKSIASCLRNYTNYKQGVANFCSVM